MSAPSLRRAERADLGPIVDALLQLSATGTAADPRYQVRPDARPRLRELLRESWFDRFLPFPPCWLAEVDGRLVGVVSAEIVPDHPILAYPPTVRFDNLWVAEDHRRAGLARTLVQQLRTSAERAGFTRFTVSTLYEDARAVAFWRAAGFRELTVILAM